MSTSADMSDISEQLTEEEARAIIAGGLGKCRSFSPLLGYPWP